MDYQLTCVCGHRFVISGAEVSRQVSCPECKRLLMPVVSAEAVAKGGGGSGGTAAGATMPTEPTKRCPFCGEVILAVAKKCKHCGEFLDRPPGGAGTSAAGAGVRSRGASAGATKSASPTDPYEPPVYALCVSQWDNFWKYLVCVTLVVLTAMVLTYVPPLQRYRSVGVLCAVVAMGMVASFFYLAARNARCYIRPTRIDTESGILAKDVCSVALFHVTDLDLKQGMIERVLGIGTIRVYSSDADTPEMVLYQIPKVRRVFAYLRERVPATVREGVGREVLAK